MSTMQLGWYLMTFGLAGVFLILILFILLIFLIGKLFPYREDVDQEQS